jgi:lipid II isoglutaminyl synthase (glutamine-hydrolysing)
MHPRASLAIAAGRLSLWGLQRARRGGTALPGLMALRVDPRLPARLGPQLGGGRVLVTGTNGKTTTSRMLSAMVEHSGRPVLHNREGSNLMRGITAAFVSRATLRGRIPGGAATTGIFETDEATTPLASAALAPSVIAITNLFRDQLDRYGEVDTVAALWREALGAAPAGSTLVLNADDPSVAELGADWPGPVHYVGIDDAAHGGGPLGASDARWCHVCGADFVYDLRFFAHLGHWRCQGCGRARPTPQTRATSVTLGLDSARFDVDGLGELSIPLSGLYNVWNALVAIGIARTLGIEDAAIRAGLAAVEPVFGRQERIAVDGLGLRLMLTKNPAGANQVVRLLAALEGPLQVAVLLNDRFADGQDVSWIWDVDYEFLAGRVERCWVGGDRAADMALRLRYAGWPGPLAIEPLPRRLRDAILRDASRPGEVFVLPTYSALLDFRAGLVGRGDTAAFWQT